MTLSVSISPHAQAKLVERAAAAGEDPVALAARLLERAIADSLLPESSAGPVAAEPAAVEEFDAVLDELFAADTRPLPDALLSYSRADIYFDHD